MAKKAAVDPCGLIGKALGNWRPVRYVREGGQSFIYEAHHCVAEELRAIVKVLPRSMAEDAKDLERFKREACGLLDLLHPCILRVYDFGYHGGTGRWYIIAEEGMASRSTRTCWTRGLSPWKWPHTS